MDKIFRVMHANDTKGMEFTAYQLKDIAYQWYDEWEELRGEDAEPVLWGEFLEAFLDHFLTLELREAKAEDLNNLK